MADLLNPSSFRKLSHDNDLLTHFASNARVCEFVKNPLLAFDNLVMTSNIPEFARKTGIRKIIFPSLREVCGNLTEEESLKEGDMRIENCESPCAASKISCEAFTRSYKRAYRVDSVILRFSNLYGMYDESDRVIPLWIAETLRSEDLIVLVENKSLDFTHR